MKNEKEFISAIQSKKFPIVVLDQKWHRLFAIHGKPTAIAEAEKTINDLLARNGKINDEYNRVKKIKSQLMNDIVQNMESETNTQKDALRQKKLSESKRLIDEINEKIEEYEDEMLEIPRLIDTANKNLIVLGMDYFYEKLKVNQEDIKEISEWITNIRIELKKNVIRKQNAEINNREIYAYLHDILGSEVLNICDILTDGSESGEE